MCQGIQGEGGAGSLEGDSRDSVWKDERDHGYEHPALEWVDRVGKGGSGREGL